MDTLFDSQLLEQVVEFSETCFLPAYRLLFAGYGSQVHGEVLKTCGQYSEVISTQQLPMSITTMK